MYVCSTRRRKPGVCSNSLRFPIADADAAALDQIEGVALSHESIESLLAVVDRGQADDSAVLQRLVGPLTLSDPDDHKAFIEWEATLTPGLLEGLAPVPVLASPPGFEPGFQP